MSENEKVRVRAWLPKFNRFSWLVGLGIVVLIIGGWKGYIAWTHMGEALPMEGECIDVSMKHYDRKDKDGKKCMWKGLPFWCVYDPNKVEWSCVEIVSPPSQAAVPTKPPAPAEQAK